MTVVNLQQGVEADVRNFLNLLFRDREGWVYTPTISRSNGVKFSQYWWEWPRQREDIVTHVMRQHPTVDCFVGPCLYKSRGNANKDNIKGSYVAYTETDGGFDPTLSPVKINFALKSSQTKGHAHLYWACEDFCDSVTQIERANKALTYAMGAGADKSVVDSTQVLRFPSTFNHKRNQPVGKLEVNSRNWHRWSQLDALDLPEVLEDTLGLDYSLKELPTPLDVIGRYACSPDLLDLMGKTIETGHRSAALFKLANLAVEHGMSNKEVLSLLYNRAVDWGKFKDRQDIQKQLNSILGKARLKHPAAGSGKNEPAIRVINSEDFLSEKWEIEWVIPGLLPQQGLMLLSGQPSVGKTQIALQYGLSMAIGRNFCGYEISHQRRILFFSLEMSEPGMHHIFGIIRKGYGLSDEERQSMKSNLHFTFPLSTQLSLTRPEGKAALREIVAQERPDGIIIDSLGQLVAGSLSDDEGMRDVLNFLRDLCKDENLFTLLVHHNRKAQVGNSAPKTLSDLYGSQYIAGLPDTIQVLWRSAGSNVIDVIGVKNRWAEERTIHIVRGENLKFELASEASTKPPPKNNDGLAIGGIHDN